MSACKTGREEVEKTLLKKKIAMKTMTQSIETLKQNLDFIPSEKFLFMRINRICLSSLLPMIRSRDQDPEISVETFPHI